MLTEQYSTHLWYAAQCFLVSLLDHHARSWPFRCCLDINIHNENQERSYRFMAGVDVVSQVGDSVQLKHIKNMFRK